MAEDPYAKYLTPPPGASPAAAPVAGGADPYAKYLTPPGAAPSAATAQPADTDYSQSPWSAAARTLAESASLGAGDLIYSHLAGTSLAGEQAKTEAAKASLPFYYRWPLEIAGYGFGAGALLSGIPEAAGITGVGAAALEGGLAGGASAALHSDDPSLGGIATGAAGGALLGGAAGAAAPLINKGLTKALGSAGKIDPDAAVAATTQAEKDAYQTLRGVSINPGHVDSAIGGVMGSLDPSVETGMSAGLRSQINDIRDALQQQRVQGNPVNGDQVNSWQRQINDAASRNRFPTDGIVAGRISSSLDNLLPSDLNAAAKTASQQRIMAEQLAEWQNKIKQGAPVGQAPLTTAETYYQGQPDQQKTLADLYKAGQGMIDPTYGLAHLGGGIGSSIGAALGGWVGAPVGHQLGFYGTKYLTKNLVNKMKTASALKQYQQAYPTLTGQPLVGASTGPQIPPTIAGFKTGDAIKNLMLGAAY